MKTVELPVTGMTCANCVATIERNLRRLDGVGSAVVNLATERARVEYDPGLLEPEQVIDRIERAGYGVPVGEFRIPVLGLSDEADALRLESALSRSAGVLRAGVSVAGELATVRYIPTMITTDDLRRIVTAQGFTVTATEDVDAEATARAREVRRYTRLLRAGVLFSLPLFLLSMSLDLFAHDLTHSLAAQLWLGWFFCLLASPVQFYVAARHYTAGYKAIRNGSANMDVLIAMGSLAAYGYSLASLLAATATRRMPGHLYFETSAVIITLVAVGKFLETGARGRTSEAVRRLMGLQARTARVVRDGAEVEVPIGDVRPGDLLSVRPGERFPVDAVVKEGLTAADESMISGESLPIDKQPGDIVIGATLNLTGWVRAEALRVGHETLLAQIVRLVQEAQSSKAPVQRLADVIAAVFVPIVLGVAAVTFTAWYFSGPDRLAVALINAVAVLVIACPCAMGLATPTAVTVAMGRGAEAGILFKSGEALERTARVSIVALDKTGTLTLGKPQVTVVRPLQAALSEDDLLALAARAELGSEHPYGRAVVSAAHSRGHDPAPPSSFLALVGHGVRAEINGHFVLVGSVDLLRQHHVVVDATAAVVREELQATGCTPLAVAEGGALLGFLGVADVPRAEAGEALKQVVSLGVRAILISGDAEGSVRAAAAATGIEEYYAEIKPAQKLEIVRRKQDEGAVVALVGDGINDAPALAQSDVGIALGSGTDVAMAAAPVTLVKPDLRKVPAAIMLARRTLRTIYQNLFWAFFYNVVLIPVAALGLLNPMLAAGAMAFSSLFVVSNSLRLRRVSIERKQAATERR